MCPFLDHADPRCGAHLTLRNIFSAFAHCADCYQNCPVYEVLTRDVASHRQPQNRPRHMLAAS